MSKLQYAQEYLAKFLDDLQRVFSDEDIKRICILKRRKLLNRNGAYFIGCDVGRKEDPFTFEIVDKINKNTFEQVENLTNINVPLPESTRRIMALNTLYNFKKVYIDSGGMGISVCDMLRENAYNKRKVVEINNASRRYQDEDGKEKKKGIFKEDLYKNLMNLIDQKKLLLLDDDDIKLSLASIQVEFDKGRERYFGNNTHIVEGLVRAVWCAKDKTLKPYIS